MLLLEAEYTLLHNLVFNKSYAGYRPEIQESPDGNNVWDTKKRYAHIAPKYLTDKVSVSLWLYFNLAFEEAEQVYQKLNFPEYLKPDYHQCCMRILEYPPGASSALHTDFDFMTLQLFRDNHEGFERVGSDASDDEISNGIHFGEIAELAELRKATPHKVVPLDQPQKSIVFFVLPSLEAVIPNKTGKDIVVGDWLKERYARSRR